MDFNRESPPETLSKGTLRKKDTSGHVYSLLLSNGYPWSLPQEQSQLRIEALY